MKCIVEVKDVWKQFPMNKNRPGFKEFLVNLRKFSRKTSNSSFWALKGISFEVKSGECLGVIGRNGAGKSSLLTLILGNIYPTRGEIRVLEKVTPLLELGSGFHPDLTGRENILINGVLLGFTKDEVMERMDDIIVFSEIAEFVDVPVRTYSNGMRLRLSFSIAIHTDPKLLLIDEILAVGDISFRKKSKDAIVRLIKGGVATILASHDLKVVKEICNRAIWLDKGKVRAEGNPGEVVAEYVKGYSAI